MTHVGRHHRHATPSLRFLVWVIAATSLGCVPRSVAFLGASSRRYPTRCAINALPTPEESAQALTDYMAKSHDAKLKAVAEEAAKYKARIKELEEKLAACESQNSQESSIVATTPQPTSPEPSPIAELPTVTALSLQNQKVEKEYTSYEFPATNKALTERIAAYRSFISEYIVQAQIEKSKAVAEAEKKARSQYEELLQQKQQQ